MSQLLTTILTVLVAPLSLAVLNYILKGRESNLGKVVASVHNIEKTGEATAAGTRAILRYRLIKDMKTSLLDGYTTVEKLTEISNLYDSYIKLGGNSIVCTLYEDYKKLPLRKEK